MRIEEKRVANDHQIRLYFTYYDRFWRLHKLLMLREALRNREHLQSVFREFYGDGYFDFEKLAYQNITNGILSDAVSETVMYCEDYLSLLKFIREKHFFVKHTVSYTAGIVANIASRLRTISREQAERLFFLPPSEIVQTSFARTNAGTAYSSIQQFSEGIDRLIEKHQTTVRFFEQHRDAHAQYKHGLKLCLNGLGGELADEELQRRKREFSGSVFVLQNKPAKEAARAGGVMIPDISVGPIRKNLAALFEERNLLHLETLYVVDIDGLIQMAKGISQLLNVLVANRIALIDNQSLHKIEADLPSPNVERMTSMHYVFDLFPDQTCPKIEDYQLKL
ncbi:MAG: hypothetical protein KIT42_15020 [Rhodocyclaceae bacterium]|nr:hypothetical protein [Rhodocyclaceae bacterium]MCW5597187.1 hypothetical protein [Rhodocyclaceae bacterium]